MYIKSVLINLSVIFANTQGMIIEVHISAMPKSAALYRAIIHVHVCNIYRAHINIFLMYKCPRAIHKLLLMLPLHPNYGCLIEGIAHVDLSCFCLSWFGLSRFLNSRFLGYIWAILALPPY